MRDLNLFCEGPARQEREGLVGSLRIMVDACLRMRKNVEYLLSEEKRLKARDQDVPVQLSQADRQLLEQILEFSQRYGCELFLNHERLLKEKPAG